ncbi:Molybdopterin binding protein [Ascobolus immersus RN42]|uniref:Molybdopterin binding protein n=1 Tax=Ascobolus immersus RN42 TaxID=1160509 RepID=A0A3N4II07_ASCIM|nr:Molybdopterin binding protein [Ascobolus immersus RN42]
MASAERPTLPPTPIPNLTTLKPLKTAAAIIIGDEVLNGKTTDTNSSWFAKYCFSHGLDLQRIEVIPDDELDIIDSCRRLTQRYDFIITTGGIGPTHDDITYQSIANAFELPLGIHEETVARMKVLSKTKPGHKEVDWEVESPQLNAKLRMAKLPAGEIVDYIYPCPDLWVPIVKVRNIHILPGIPTLFRQLMDALTPYLPLDASHKSHRILISTPLGESEVAEYLTNLQEMVEPKGIKIGSYPRWGRANNTITMTGKDLEFMESLVEDVCNNTNGERFFVEEKEEVEKVKKQAERGEKSGKIQENL